MRHSGQTSPSRRHVQEESAARRSRGSPGMPYDPYPKPPPVHDAVRRGDMRAMLALLEAGSDVNQCAGGWGTPLSAAAGHGNASAARALLARGADPDAAAYGEGTSTPLMVAAHAGSPEVVELLLEAGADVNRADARAMHSPALVWALDTARPSRRVVEMLLEAGADANFRSYVYSPLRGALNAHDAYLVRLLVEHGADPDTTSVWGVTALTWAIRRGDADLVDLLISRGANVALTGPGDLRSCVPLLGLAEDSGMLWRLIIHPLRLRIAAARVHHIMARQRPVSDPPLVTAVKKGNTRILEALLRAGANPAQTDRQGRDARYWARRLRRRRILELLQE